MIFSYNWLQSFFKEKLAKPEKLAELLTMHSFEVEEVEKKGDDWVLDINVLPDRASYCFSHIGIAEEIAAILKSKIKSQNYIPPHHPPALRAGTSSKVQVKSQKFRTDDFVKVEVQDQEDCPRYSAKLITGVKVAASPKWMQERLRVCGLQPINNIVDIANYVMLEMGQPLHAFDFDKVKSMNAKCQMPNAKSNPKSKCQKKKIIVRRAKKGEKIKTLDVKTYSLDEDILVIADEEKPIAIAGIKGGETTGIDQTTKDVIVEAANFEQRVIRAGSQKLKLRTDASLRFEHGFDPNLIPLAQERAANLIQEMAGGRTAQGLADFYPKKVKPKIIGLDLNYLEHLLGTKIPIREVKNILGRIGLNVKCQMSNVKTKCQMSNVILVEVPTFRLDINLPEDLIEEIGRIYGYEKIPSVLPKASLVPSRSEGKELWLELLSNTLKELGFCEVYNYSFISQKDEEVMRCKEELVELENPLSSDFKYLRPNLLIGLLKNVRQNAKHFDGLSLFELGKTFQKSLSKKLRKKATIVGFLRNLDGEILEKTMLSGVIFAKKPQAELFYELKGVCDVLLERLGIAGIWYDEYQPSPVGEQAPYGADPEDSALDFWQKGRCAEIKSGQEELGFLGGLSTGFLNKLGIQGAVYGFDFDLEKLLKYASEEQDYQPISRYPAASRDVAVLVPLLTKTEEVLNVIEVAGGKLVRDIDLFDTYEGEELPEGKKNLAFHIIFQAEDRTLPAQEIDELMQKIFKAVEENTEWEVRK